MQLGPFPFGNAIHDGEFLKVSGDEIESQSLDVPFISSQVTNSATINPGRNTITATVGGLTDGNPVLCAFAPTPSQSFALLFAVCDAGDTITMTVWSFELAPFTAAFPFFLWTI